MSIYPLEIDADYVGAQLLIMISLQRGISSEEGQS